MAEQEFRFISSVVKGWSTFGGGTGHGNLSDDLDGTGLQADNPPSAGQAVELSIADINLASDERIKQVRCSVRFERDPGFDTGWYHKVTAYFKWNTLVTAQDVFTNGTADFLTFDGGWRTHQPGGLLWTEDVFNVVRLKLVGSSTNPTWFGGPVVSEAWVYADVNTQPATTSVTITGASTSSQPTVNWLFSDADGDAQAAFQAKVFSSSQYGTPDFDVDESSSVWNSNIQSSSASDAEVGVPLETDITYKAYVRTAQDFNGTLWWSEWAESSPTVTTFSPSTAATLRDSSVDESLLRVLLRAQGHVNILTANQASAETDTSGMDASGATLTRSTTQAKQGAWSWSLSASGAGDMFMFTDPRLPAPGGGNQFGARASFRASTTGRSCKLVIDWYDDTGTFISSDISGSSTDNNTGWTTIFMTGTTPENADTWLLSCDVDNVGGSGEIHYIDEITVAPGTADDLTLWGPGGLTDVTTLYIERFQGATSPVNLLDPDLASCQFVDAFFAREASDSVTLDPINAYQGDWVIFWVMSETGSVLDIGFPHDAFPLADGRHRVIPAIDGQSYVLTIWLKATATTDVTLFITSVTGANDGAVDTSTDVTVTTDWQPFQLVMTNWATNGVWARAAIANDSGLSDRSLFIGAMKWTAGTTADTSWTPGKGLLATSDNFVRVRGREAVELTADQEANAWDHEPPPNIPVVYRARVEADTEAGSLTSGLAADSFFGVHMFASGQWWLKDPFDSLHNTLVFVTDESNSESVEEDGADFHPIGRDTILTVTDFVSGVNGSFTIMTRGESESQRVIDLLGTGRPLLLITPEGTQRYVKIKGQTWPRSGTTGDIRRHISISYVETDRP